METGPQLKVSSDRLVKPGIKPATPGLQGKRFIYYTTAAPIVFYFWGLTLKVPILTRADNILMASEITFMANSLNYYSLQKMHLKTMCAEVVC